MPRKVFLLLTSSLLFISFVIFSYNVAKEKYTKLDFDTTVRLQDHISRRFDLSFSLFSVLGSVEVTGILWLVIFLFVIFKKYWLTALSLIFFVLSLFFEVFGKVFVEHPGPPFLFYRGVLDFNFPSHYVPTNYSYPSGHITRTSFLVVFLILFLHAKFPKYFSLPVILFLLGFLLIMIVSRVYLGEHWSSDVIGGLLLGSSLGVLSGLTIPINKKKYQSDSFNAL